MVKAEEMEKGGHIKSPKPKGSSNLVSERIAETMMTLNERHLRGSLTKGRYHHENLYNHNIYQGVFPT